MMFGVIRIASGKQAGGYHTAESEWGCSVQRHRW
jgi:hypothetical protein